ncbi:hypothetical protein [Derxia gummosa]|uniref:Uncharacterized protein n=1 Tax=Derxia gummosa DSM 723 TaxID=1121388 RepID=A0A8B6X613_9BURK|nr:hypothetical protein [Derxia gummosa]
MPLLLCFFLLFGQSLGLLHRVAHGPAVDAPALTATALAADVSAPEVPRMSETASVFGHVADRIACALFDGAALAAALPGVTKVLALLRAPALRVLASAVAVCELRRIAAFLSRAPPHAVPFA